MAAIWPKAAPVTFRTRQGASTTRGIFLMLTALAVALKVMIPAGFMTRAATNDLPFALVLCTAQGAVTVEPGETAGHDSPDDVADHDSPCAFVGHAAAAPAPSPIATGDVEFVAYRRHAAPVAAVDLAPGRGLAAPPLPARGPPSLLI